MSELGDKAIVGSEAPHAEAASMAEQAGSTLTLRVTEARVEDVGHAIGRLAPVDLSRIGARAGDVLKITGSAPGFARAGLADEAYEGMDLEALAQEVGMIALRSFLSATALGTGGHASTELRSLQVTRDDFLAGLREVEPSATREFGIEKGETTFASLGGFDEVKRQLASVVEHSHLHAELYEKFGLEPPRGILLVGPAGIGKTAMARALSGEKQLPLIAVDGPQVYSKWLGDSERALREVFKKARRAAPCILFFDMLDALAPRFVSSYFATDVYQRILSQLLREIDNLRDVKGVILLAATNHLERIDPAFLRGGRFDYILTLGKPGPADRAAILRLCCKRLPLAPDVDLTELAAHTEGLTGANIESLCKKATLSAIAEFQRGTRPASFFVTRNNFFAVLNSDRSPDPKTVGELSKDAADLCPDAFTATD